MNGATTPRPAGAPARALVPISALSDTDIAAIHDRLATDSGLTIASVARELGVKRRRLSERLSDWRAGYLASNVEYALDRPSAPRPAPTGESVKWTENGTGASVESPKSGRIRTLDGLLAAADVDLTRWMVDHHVINTWEVGSTIDGQIVVEPLWQVKAWMKPIPGVSVARAVIGGLIDDFRTYVPPSAPIAYPALAADNRHMLELDPFDLHVGMMAWAAETGADYDSDIASRCALAAFERLLSLSSGIGIEEILIPLGNDFLHTDKMLDGKGGTTTRGTQQDVDTRRPKMIRLGIRLACALIDLARTIAPVRVLMVRGNHDEESMLWLGEVLSERYRDVADVVVTNSDFPYQYVHYGNTLLGFCHGHETKADNLQAIMMTDCPQAYAATKHHEWHIGHKHRKGEVVFEISGLRVRTMPSLAAGDHWHVFSGYRHMRAMEAYIWHREHCYVGHFSCPVVGYLDGLVAA
jgi:hypothetical protein